MKLVKITHDRCAEYDGTEYVLAPEDWDAAKIKETVDKVCNQIIIDAKLIKNPPTGAPSFHPEYKEYPDKTVREVEELHAQEKAKYDAWKKENSKLTRSFVDRLRDAGFVGLWEDSSGALKVTAHWGHNHGLDLGYKRSEF